MKKQQDKRYWGYDEYTRDNLKWRVILGLLVAAVCVVVSFFIK